LSRVMRVLRFPTSILHSCASAIPFRVSFFFQGHGNHHVLHSFPTRRSSDLNPGLILNGGILNPGDPVVFIVTGKVQVASASILRSEEHTSELQSRVDLVCRLLLEKKKRF